MGHLKQILGLHPVILMSSEVRNLYFLGGRRFQFLIFATSILKKYLSFLRPFNFEFLFKFSFNWKIHPMLFPILDIYIINTD